MARSANRSPKPSRVRHQIGDRTQGPVRAGLHFPPQSARPDEHQGVYRAHLPGGCPYARSADLEREDLDRVAPESGRVQVSHTPGPAQVGRGACQPGQVGQALRAFTGCEQIAAVQDLPPPPDLLQQQARGNGEPLRLPRAVERGEARGAGSACVRTARRPGRSSSRRRTAWPALPAGGRGWAGGWRTPRRTAGQGVRSLLSNPARRRAW